MSFYSFAWLSYRSELAESCIEAKSLVSAIIDVNSPKLFSKDSSVMLSLLEDLFGASVLNEATIDQHAITLMVSVCIEFIFAVIKNV